MEENHVISLFSKLLGNDMLGNGKFAGTYYYQLYITPTLLIEFFLL